MSRYAGLCETAPQWVVGQFFCNISFFGCFGAEWGGSLSLFIGERMQCTYFTIKRHKRQIASGWWCELCRTRMSHNTVNNNAKKAAHNRKASLCNAMQCIIAVVPRSIECPHTIPARSERQMKEECVVWLLSRAAFPFIVQWINDLKQSGLLEARAPRKRSDFSIESFKRIWGADARPLRTMSECERELYGSLWTELNSTQHIHYSPSKWQHTGIHTYSLHFRQLYSPVL